jgi:hypothetical protein
MKKSWFYLGILSTLTMILTGCGGEGENKAANPAPAASTPAAPTASPTAAFNQPTVAAKPTVADKPVDATAKTATTAPAIDIAAGLIPPTDADDWSKTVSKGRLDPFAAIQLQPVEVFSDKDKLTIGKIPAATVKSAAANTAKAAIAPKPKTVLAKTIKAQPQKLPAIARQVKIKEAAVTKVSLGKVIKAKNTLIASNPKMANGNAKFVKLATAQGKKSLPAIAANNKKGITVTQKAKSNSAIALREVKPAISNIAPISAAPVKEPLQAQAVGVSGIIQFGGKTQVIVKLPAESFSRYVEVGDRIANGSVLVKRVEGEQTLTPIVVLEEEGIEVKRQLGDGVTVDANQAAVKQKY